jgi:hypothetical protein
MARNPPRIAHFDVNGKPDAHSTSTFFETIATTRRLPRLVLPEFERFGYKSIALKEFQVIVFPLSSMDAMPVESFPTRISQQILRPRTAGHLSCIACGIYSVCWLQQALAGFGTSLSSQTALAIVALVAAGAASAIISGLTGLRVLQTTQQRLSLLVILHVSAGATVLLSGVMYGAGWSTIEALLGGTLPSSAAHEVAVFCAGLSVSWLVPFAAVALMLVHPEPRRDEKSLPLSFGRRLCVAAVSAALAITFVSSLDTAMWIALCTGIVTIAIECAALIRNPTACASGEVADQPPIIQPKACSEQNLSLTTPSLLWAIPVVLLCGCLFATLSRISGQLFFAASWQSVAQWSSVVLVMLLSRRLIARGSLQPTHLLLIASAWSIVLLTGWPLLVRICLELNSGVSTIAIAGTVRAFITVACVLPVGLALGAVATRGLTSSRETAKPTKSRDEADTGRESMFRIASTFEPVFLLSTFLVGWLASRWWAMTSFGVAESVVGMSLALTGIALVDFFRRESWRSAVRPTVAICGIVVLAGPLLVKRYDPTTSAKLLFDTAVFVAHQREARTDILPYLDEGRCIATAEADHGTLTFWRYRGQQLQIRESGLPLSAISCDTTICAQPSAESLQAILPMVLHEGPTRLLLLGVRSGAVLQTSISFPLESIVCVESDRGLINAVSEQVFSRVEPNPLDDMRVDLRRADPLLILRMSPGTADIVIASADQQGVPRAASMVTAEFLTSASAALREGGLFCQPVDYADFGPDALQVIVETWQSVFADVAAIEIAPGKFLFIGTNSESGIVRPGIIDRLKRPHVRFALAQTGWDWSTPLLLSIYTDRNLTAAFGEPRHRISDVSGNRLTCLLPWEVMRWSDKYSAIMNKLSPHAQTMQFTVGEDAYTSDVKNRLTELTQQRALIQEHPDEYWVYRRKVKDRLTNTPQSRLVQVKGEEPLHELQVDEKRRVDYFKALGAAAKNRSPDHKFLQSVEEFASPYDPLISLFLHQELAELATRNRAENFDIELRHRLHRTYFSASTDQAIRNIVAAIELLCEHPEAISDDADRGDQLDALLQMLHDRWHNRGDTPPDSSKIVLNDIEKSLAAIDEAFDALDALRSARGYSAEQWQSRQLALEKSLVRPLQAYRTTLMPHHARSR